MSALHVIITWKRDSPLSHSHKLKQILLKLTRWWLPSV